MNNDKDPVTLNSGDTRWIPMGVFHSTVNTSETDLLELIVVYSPAGAGGVPRDAPDVDITSAGEKS